MPKMEFRPAGTRQAQGFTSIFGSSKKGFFEFNEAPRRKRRGIYTERLMSRSIEQASGDQPFPGDK
jgi:hypothetical protein